MPSAEQRKQAISNALRELRQRVEGFIPFEQTANIASLFIAVHEAAELTVEGAAAPRDIPSVDELLETMQATVLAKAKESGKLRMHVHHADHYWTVEVYPDGSTAYEDYAEMARGPRGTLPDLTMTELAQLLEQR